MLSKLIQITEIIKSHFISVKTCHPERSRGIFIAESSPENEIFRLAPLAQDDKKIVYGIAFRLIFFLLLPFVIQAKSSQVVVYARGADAVTLDPANILDGESAKVSEQIFEGLVTYKPGSTEVVPCLATSWTSSDDNKIWDFRLRQGVAFHDGSPFNAEAVVFSFARQYDVQHKAHKGTFEYWGLFKDIIKVEAIDNHTVRFHLKRPYAPLLSNLAMFSASIISPKSWEKFGERIFENPVGTGPWTFSSWRRGEAIVLKKNSNYWGAQPQADQLIFKVVEKSPIRLKLLQKGDVHIADGLAPVDVKRAQKDGALNVVTAVGMNVGYLAFNNDKKPFDDPHVRRALALTLDTNKLANALFRGFGQAAASPLPPCLWGTDPSLKPLGQDIEEAKRLLAAAGLASGFKTKLVFGNNPRPYLPEPKKAALYIKSQFRKVSVDVTLEEMEWGAYLEHTKYGNHQMCLLGWNGDNGDPDNFLEVLLSSRKAKKPAMNLSFYRSSQVDGWLIQAQEESQQSARAKLYQKALRQIYADVPLLPLVHAEQLAVTRKSIQGFKLHPNGVRKLTELSMN